MKNEVTSDPDERERMQALQDEACTALSAIIDKTAAMLMAGSAQESGRPGALDLLAQQPFRLGTESTRRRQAWANAREAAELLVIGALINKDNPDWDPADPASSVEVRESPLLAMLRRDLDS